MKLITTKVECRGCKHANTVKSEAPRVFKLIRAPFTCSRCGSMLVCEIKKAWFKNKIQTRVLLVEHTKKLLEILKRNKLKDLRAKNHTKK